MNNSELIIIDEVIGTGKETTKGALLIANYDGFLEDGAKFDSSYDRGKPFQFVFGTGRVIKGWDQGLVGMREGGKRTLHVPAYLAYGERQIGDLIKPHSNLIFHVELLEVRTRD
jgi:peptidylprolyl isomerase